MASPAPPPAAVRTVGLRRSYGEQVVLDGIDLSVADGSIFALLGPNGAGKTTVVKILSTLIGSDAGEAFVAGHDVNRDPDAVRAVIGVTGQFSAVDELLTGRENLRLMADLRRLGQAKGQGRADDLLEQFGLVEAADKTAGTYSGGMKRRLDLAMTLVGTPRLIFLDEPTTGLDPGSRREMWRIIRELADAGVTIFLTTQYLEEADQLADHIAVLDQGRLVAEGTPEQLKRRIPGGHVLLLFPDTDAMGTAAGLLGGSVRDDKALSLQVPSDGSLDALRSLIDQLDTAGVAVDALSVHMPDLDDVFLTLTGRPTQPATATPEGDR